VTAERLDELTALAKREPGRDKVFHYLPFCFAGSRIVLWTCLYRNNPLMMSTDLNVLKDELAVADPNYFLNVPTLLERVRRGVEDAVAKQGGLGQKLYERGHTAAMKLRHGTGTLSDRLFAGIAGKMVFPKIKRKIGPSLEFLICGSAPLSEETQAWFEMIGIPVYQVYGLTETTAIVTMDLPDAVAPGRVGFAVPGVEAKLGEEDELLCRGPNICSGYWNRPDATSEAIVDGWFHTGDQCEVDAAGNWRIVGRVKNLLVPESGHNVAPEPLEQKVREACSAVEQAVVVGHGRPFLSVIVTGNVAQNQIATALERVNKELPHYRRLRKFHHSEELFTPENGLLTANQKMKRGVIEKHFSVAINRMYA
jgi:long-chain acyl-CoA synthetase